MCQMNEKLDVAIIGAGAAGLACGIEAKQRGLKFCIFDRGTVVNSIYRFPVNMKFFTTAELLEIGKLPLTSPNLKPRRVEVLKYYRRVAEHYELPIRDYEEVLSVTGSDGAFQIRSRDRFEEDHTVSCRKVIVATGYYDNPNMMGIPGEELDKVHHYYSEPHPFFGKRVAVIGGKNSAVEAALDLYRNQVDVSLIYRGPALGKHIKYWVLPDIQNRIRKGEILVFLSTEVVEIRPREIVLETPGGVVTLPNDFVLAMTGYHLDVDFLGSMGIELEAETLIPRHDPETLETNVKGLYVAGAIVAGRMTNRIFIENGRFHGEQIFRHWPQRRTVG